MLCDDCYEFRFPKNGSDRSSNVPAAENATSLAIQCELLCFLQDKSGVMADDHLVQLCSDFYRKEEVDVARSLVEQYIGQPSGKPHRMPHRKGADAMRATIDDLLKVILNPNLKLPVFMLNLSKDYHR